MAIFVFWVNIDGCYTISLYDQYAYTQDVNLKVESLKVMAEAVESYTKHISEIVNITTEMEKCFEYEKGRPMNQITTNQWVIMKDPNRDLLGGFFKLWKQKDILDKEYIEHKSKDVGYAFDQIIGLESGKIHQ